MQETRNVLIEAARITRGDIRPLAQAVLNGTGCVDRARRVWRGQKSEQFCQLRAVSARVDSDLAALAVAMHQAGKPLGFMCIAPAMLPKIFLTFRCV